ncbi:MAG: ribosome maturation factor RimM [Pseudomonadota bacterium]
MGRPNPALLLMGVITGAHGLRGQVSVKSFAEVPEDLAAYGPLCDATGRPTYRLTIKGRTRGQLLAAVKGVTDRNGAEALRGTELFLPRALLPDLDEEEDFYYADLIGLRVEEVSGKILGQVAAVQNHGAGDLLILRGEGGTEIILPFTKAVVPTVDLAGGRLLVVPPEEVVVPPTPRAEEETRDG